MRKLSYGVYRGACWLAARLFPGPVFEGTEHLPADGCIVVGNHAQMYGPVMAELYFPGERVIWCNSEMMHMKEVPEYAYRDFWSRKPKATRWIFRGVSYIIAPLCPCIFNNAHCIPVYRDMRVMGTFRQTLQCLKEQKRVIIFPEQDTPRNNIVYEFQDHFIDVARLYAHQTGQPLRFVPMYVSPKMRKVIFGEPIPYDLDAAPDAERERICRALMDAVTEIALAQPRHRVVPYRNMSRRAYPYNTRS